MAKLFTKKKDAIPEEQKALDNSGALPVSSGMTTENNPAIIHGSEQDTEKDKTKTKKDKTKTKKVKPETEVSFYIPFAMMGKSAISIPHPVLDAKGNLTGETVDKQINIKDKFYTVLKKDVKNDAYWKELKKLFVAAGLEAYSTVKNVEELAEFRKMEALKPPSKAKAKKTQKVFGAYRDEHLGNDQTFNFSFQCGDKVRVFAETNGQLFTDDSEMHKIFLANHYSDMGYIKDSQKLSKEILPKKEEGKVGE